MRHLTHIDNPALAQRFSDFLYLQKIDNEIRPEEDGSCALWIYSDDDIPQAQKLLDEFLHNPNASHYLVASPRASFRRFEEQKQNQNSGIIDVRSQIFGSSSKLGPVTITLIAISILVALISQLGRNTDAISYLFITDYQISGNYLEWRRGFPEIMRGQVWRLITPIFVHFGFFHILFNMLWLKDLGGMLEQHEGAWLLLLQVLIIGALSNLAQYYWSGPSFGGMSGVVYGLLGYIWIRGKLDPYAKLILNPSVVTMMIVWFFLCLTGLIGPVANAAHAGGLGIGMLWGFLSAQYSRHFRK